ncbi:multidrug resistance-associated protein 5 [Biomphalaria pfeifferi]|uniref:Multidrug resistance-associated protein 5 n=1 Tax=Biomphalaria pfeifferi TaxID=112525 RepID=A0AAD8EV18_BIOPF|nr:multidrug resistance-associated protein 5 [Biomphalaria pfeifferi]
MEAKLKMAKTHKHSVDTKSKNGVVRSISQTLEQRHAIHNSGKFILKVPISRAGLLSRASFWWMWGIMLGLYKHGLSSLSTLSWWNEDSTEASVQRLEKCWNEELADKSPSQASLRRAIRRAFKFQLLRAVLVICITLSFSFIGSACILRLLLDHISSNEPDIKIGIIIVIALIVCEFCRSFTFSLTWSLNYMNGMRGRAAAMGLLYKKILNLRSLQDKKIGELVNMFSHDGQRVFEALVNGPFTVGGPFIFLAGSIYLGLLMGLWALVGIGTYIFVFVVMKFLNDGIEHFRTKAVNLTGQRVGLMTEVLTCMKLIKMNGWESSFIDRITERRKKERVALERCSFLKSVVTSLVPMIPVIASVVMFLGYILSGNHLTAARAFTVISVFYAMSFSLASALYGVQTLIDVSVAMTRYQEILIMPEKSVYEKPKDETVAVELNMATLTWESIDEEDMEATDEDSIIAGLKPEDVKILTTKSPLPNQNTFNFNISSNPDIVESATALLPKPKKGRESMDTLSLLVPALQEIDITVKKGELIGICGMKGCGKSSLLAAILGRMQILDGDLKVSGSIAFVSQDPWIVNGTAKENILFGLPYDKEKYDRIIKATKLDIDFETFSAKDGVEIGDRGLTLSGGQKQRICLARAIYSDSDILLLDDPLATVDVNMGRHIFAQCIKTILHDKTVFMVTHHLEYLPKCDKVLYMHEGRVVTFGSHADLMTKKGAYSELFTLYNNKYDRILKERMLYRDRKEVRMVPQRGFSRVSEKVLNHQLSMISMTAGGIQHQFSVVSSTSLVPDYEHLDLDDLTSTGSKLDCMVKTSTYKTYIKAMGGVAIFILLLFSFLVSIAIQSLTTGYLAYWLDQGSGLMVSNISSVNVSAANFHADNITESVLDNPHINTYAFVYGMFLLAMLIILVGRSLVFVKLLLRASTSLHQKLVKKTLQSPMKFFDATPIGIILNRFSADMDEIDVRLPANCELFLQNVFLVLSALVLISIVFPFDLLAILPLMVIFGVLAHMFAPILQQLKFMDNVTRSPYLSHLAASVEGIATINSFNQGPRFYQKFCDLVNRNSIPFFLFYAANRWIAVFLDCMTIVVIGATGVLIVLNLSPENSSEAGLALSFAIQITSLVQYSLRLSMETISRFSSVQRIQDCVENFQSEGSVINNPQTPPASWPSEGAITFKQYKMRYNDGQPPVIKGISVNIQAKEKIGIVGNSGSGKSSLGVALFRLSEAASGTITIDNINIRDVPLEILRSRLSILVQDPVLFTGTVRYNLDPSNTIKSDNILWQALDKCHIKNKIESLECGLDTLVEENGRNFSMGERQLLCLARILLRNTKILVLDEATASVDATTEALVQQTIKECFQNCTVLMIAHRINTVWDCDKILVMEQGKMVEFNHPTVLLQKSFSRFKSMFEMLKSQPRGASINEDPLPTTTSRASSSPRLPSSPHLPSPLQHTPTSSPFGELSPLKDESYDDSDENDDALV